MKRISVIFVICVSTAMLTGVLLGMTYQTSLNIREIRASNTSRLAAVASTLLPPVVHQSSPMKCRADEERVWRARESFSTLDYVNPKPPKGYCRPRLLPFKPGGRMYERACPAGQKVFLLEQETPATRALFLRGRDYVCVPGS